MSTIAFEVLGPVRVRQQAAADDLLTAGLGLSGLRQSQAPVPADAQQPTAAELRRMAIHANWRGIADLRTSGGVESVFSQLPAVAGEEHHALLRLSDRRVPQRVLLQIPEHFDPRRPVLVVAPASGSRGVYGALAVAGPWALPRGYALLLLDKGAGTGLFDPRSGTGADIDGKRAPIASVLEFAPADAAALSTDDPRLALRHFHSQEHPEQDWGRMLLAAVDWALDRLTQRFPAQAPFTASTTRVIATAISNGAGAALQAAERDNNGVLDLVVVGEPNVHVEHSRPLYDYATEAALLQPCILLDPRLADLPFNSPTLQSQAACRGRSLHERGLVQGSSDVAHAANALDQLLASGWTLQALAQAGGNLAFDAWRMVAVGYASAYTRSPWHAMPAGYGCALVDPRGRPQAATPQALETWWALGSGIVGNFGLGIIDTLAAGEDPNLPGLLELRALWTGASPLAARLRESVAQTRVLARPRVPVFIVHGRDDGLIPVAFSAKPYVESARSAGLTIDYCEIANAQHFDAFLALIAPNTRFVPLLPHLWQALDRAWATLET